MLSERYGAKILQRKVSYIEYNQIKSKCLDKDKSLLDNFYELDENFKENKFYLLKPANETQYEVLTTNYH